MSDLILRKVAKLPHKFVNTRIKKKRESVIGKGKIFYENHIIDFTSFATIKPTRTCIYNNRIAGKETKIDSIDKNLRFFNNFILYQSYI